MNKVTVGPMNSAWIVLWTVMNSVICLKKQKTCGKKRKRQIQTLTKSNPKVSLSFIVWFMY